MKRDNLFWGAMLMLLGTLFLLDNLGFFPGIDVWVIFISVFLMALGVWIIISYIWRRKSTLEHVEIPLDGAGEARLILKHAAGRLDLSGADLGDKLLKGDCAGGVSVRTLRVGDLLELDLGTRKSYVAIEADAQRLDWQLIANRGVLYDRIELHSGASEAELDLSGMRVALVQVKTGASSTKITMPRQGHSRLEADAGAATIAILVPEGVSARIHGKGGLFTLTVDERRFPRQGDFFVSPDFETAINRLEVEVTTGMGAVNVE